MGHSGGVCHKTPPLCPPQGDPPSPRSVWASSPSIKPRLMGSLCVGASLHYGSSANFLALDARGLLLLFTSKNGQSIRGKVQIKSAFSPVYYIGTGIRFPCLSTHICFSGRAGACATGL